VHKKTKEFRLIHCRSLLLVLLIGGSLLLSACGFHLRGDTQLKVASIYLNAPKNSAITLEANRLLRANGVKTTENEKDAELILDILNEGQEQSILTFTSAGVAREIELRYRLTFRVRGPSGEVLIDSKQLNFRRELLTSEGFALPREAEQLALYKDMKSDAVQQIVRQLEFIKMPPKKVAEPQ